MDQLFAHYKKYRLQFRQPAGTSRGVLHDKPTYFLFVEDKEHGTQGIGECSTIVNLSMDDRNDYEEKLTGLCALINMGEHPDQLFDILDDFPSISFGLETALKDLEHGGERKIYDTPFARGERDIPINGLIWMGSPEDMKQQIDAKLKEDFCCVKLKIGAVDFEEEISLIQNIRDQYPAEKVEIRVDANGAFAPDEALDKLQRLADLEVHSIEQPIKQGQWKEMAHLCVESPLHIALDEELIGILGKHKKEELLETIRPQFLILKPSLHGGISGCEEWIALAGKLEIDWWVTSALESNIGLNAIAQWVDHLKVQRPQGLGTGQLYTNNIPSPLTVKNGYLRYDKKQSWDIAPILEES